MVATAAFGGFEKGGEKRKRRGQGEYLYLL
jgi:hypothetical protein